MAAGDVTTRENHDHQCRANGQRSNHASRSGNNRAADGEDEEERADKFRDVFFHSEVD